LNILLAQALTKTINTVASSEEGKERRVIQLEQFLLDALKIFSSTLVIIIIFFLFF